ncbi:TonB-dependent receptor plug domain-containing protein [Bdellovibrio reynosensis]|uniref:TonB-dependent receptor n=1 Tax=Bdellovibrio reynosensis TaxID=2835041 RepID=A0ABY4C716_9BACT|nr:TonB-dependent receptor [Bdellovibrio reynosensis]UOF00504.1 TonB-dependent receptor [Bdellovibrio reynosensis]
MKNIFVMGLLLGSLSTYAQINPVVVESSSVTEESADTSSWVTVLDETEIKNQNKSTVADLLRDVPGVEVVRQGGVGQTTSIFIRGARSEDTLVLIDGIRANELMSPAGGFDFSSLASVNIARIEVHRGPQSVRFGSGAIGGVINIITKEGKGPLAVSYVAEAGSYDTLRAGVSVYGRQNNLGYSAGVEGLKTAGFSAADKSQGNTEADGATVATVSSKLTYHASETGKVVGSLRYSQAEVDLDYAGGTQGDDPNSSAVFKQLITGVTGVNHFFSNTLRSSLSFTFSEVTRFDENKADPVHVDTSENYFISELQQIETAHEWLPTSTQSLKFILSYQDESGKGYSNYSGFAAPFARERLKNTGEGFFYSYDDNKWLFDAGLRYDQQSEKGQAVSVRSSVGRRIAASDTLVRLTYGTGFKNPSLYQLYSSYGDLSLKSQDGKALDISVEQQLGERLEFSADLFRTFYDDLIDFVSGKYKNIASAQSEGIEVQGMYKVLNSLALKASYTYLETKDNTTNLRLLRRPMNAYSVSAIYSHEKIEGSVQYRFSGERDDLDPNTFARTENSSYDVVSVKASYKLSQDLKITGRIENLLDRQYQEVLGYGTPERSFFVGISN